MAYIKSFSTLAGVAALVAFAGALPAQAETLVTEASEDASLTAITEVTEATEADLVILEADLSVDPVSDAAIEEITEESSMDGAEVIPADAATTAALLSAPAAPVTLQTSTEALASFNEAGLQAALNESVPSAASSLDEGLELAQTDRRPYASVSPAYLGVAGNLGFGDPDSAIGDFGVNVISKISLGPRFSLRPGFFISERFTNFAIPLTYNFHTMSARGVRFQPYVGAGVDVPFNGNTALMVNAGADVPISRAFTLNAATNVRVTSGFGLGFSLGVGYNLPFIFQ